MKPWLKRTLVLLAVLLLVYGGFVAFASYNSGEKVDVYFNLGRSSSSAQYLRCDAAKSTPGVCAAGDQAVVTIHKRDRVTFHVHSDDGGNRAHDFKLGGWQYAIPPISPEMELHDADRSWTFTTWATGEFRIWCEIADHAAQGMQGKLVVT